MRQPQKGLTPAEGAAWFRGAFNRMQSLMCRSSSWVLAKFLQDNALTTRRLANSLSEVDEIVELRSDDLTDEVWR